MICAWAALLGVEAIAGTTRGTGHFASACVVAVLTIGGACVARMRGSDQAIVVLAAVLVYGIVALTARCLALGGASRRVHNTVLAVVWAGWALSLNGPENMFLLALFTVAHGDLLLVVEGTQVTVSGAGYALLGVWVYDKAGTTYIALCLALCTHHHVLAAVAVVWAYKALCSDGVSCVAGLAFVTLAGTATRAVHAVGCTGAALQVRAQSKVRQAVALGAS